MSSSNYDLFTRQLVTMKRFIVTFEKGESFVMYFTRMEANTALDASVVR